MRRRPSGRPRSGGRVSARAITDRNPSTTLFSVMVLVRGACGQIGSRLCTLLRTAGPLAHNLAPLSLRCSIWPAWVLFLAPAVVSAQASSRPCSAWCLSQHARDALAAGRYADYLNYARKIAQRAPDHPGVVYAVARGYALVGQPAAAFGWLSRLADLGATQDVDMDSAFAGLDTSAAFRALRARLNANRAPIVHGAPAFSLPDPDLLPEALARDPITDSWLVGSLAKRKIIRLAPNGTASDFVSDPELLRVVGIHVDSARSLLWFATWAPRAPSATHAEDFPSDTRLFKCDLVSGHILRRYIPSDSGGDHLFNDLAIATNGDVFITDTDQGAVYRIRSSADSLELFLQPDRERFSDANGITLSGDNRTLYVAFVEGIARIDLRTRAIARLSLLSPGSTAAIDGLYWYRGTLIGVQHLPGLDQVARYDLAPDGRSIQHIDVLERADSLLHLPTTGALVGGHFYYIANSQFDRLGDDNRLAPASPSSMPLSTVRVLDLEHH